MTKRRMQTAIAWLRTNAETHGAGHLTHQIITTLNIAASWQHDCGKLCPLCTALEKLAEACEREGALLPEVEVDA